MPRKPNRPDLPISFKAARGDAMLQDPSLFDELPMKELKVQRLHVRLTAKQVLFIKGYARLQGQSVTQVIEQLIEELEKSVAKDQAVDF